MDNEDLYIYILNKNALKHWKVADMLGINKVYDGKPNDLAWAGLEYNKDIGYKFFYWGVINNSSVKKVTINNERCMVEKLKPNLYVWYHFNNKESPNLKIIK